MSTLKIAYRKDKYVIFYRGQHAGVRVRNYLYCFTLSGTRYAAFILAAVSCSFAPTEGAFGLTFCRGVNMTSFLWQQRVVNAPYSPEALSLYWPAWDGEHVAFPEHRVEAIAAMGFDHVRLSVQPVPLLYEFGEARDRLLSELLAVVQRLQKHGLAVIVTLNFIFHDPFGLKQRVITSAEDNANFRALVVYIARHLQTDSSLNIRRLAFEFDNEPEHDCSDEGAARWQSAQLRLYNEVRQVAPTLNLIVTGDCWSNMDGLRRLDVAPFREDQNVLFTIHFYEPRAITFQGYPWETSGIQYFDKIPFPFTQQDLPGALSRLRNAIEHNSSVPTNEIESVFDRLKRWLTHLANTDWNADRMNARARTVADWARTQSIEPHRIYIGEFGTYWPGENGRGISRDDRSRWLNAVNAAFGEAGMGRAIFSDIQLFSILKQNDDADSDLAAKLAQSDGLSCSGSVSR
jgi:hypothetical protein